MLRNLMQGQETKDYTVEIVIHIGNIKVTSSNSREAEMEVNAAVSRALEEKGYYGPDVIVVKASRPGEILG